MSWSDEQIQQRKLSDEETFRLSLVRLADSVTGKESIAPAKDAAGNEKSAINTILAYYRVSDTEETADNLSFFRHLEKRLRPAGILYRKVTLKPSWYRDAAGPMLGYTKKDRTVVALIPDSFGRYYYREPETGEKRRVTRTAASGLCGDAIFFYRPFPRKSMTVTQLYNYIFRGISAIDIVFTVLAALTMTGIGLLTTSLFRFLTSTVMTSDEPGLFPAVAISMFCVAIASFMIDMTRGMLFERMNSRMSVEVEAAAMERILSLPPSFFGNYSSGELMIRIGYVKQLSSTVLNLALSSGLTSVFSLVYIAQIYAIAPKLALPSLIVVLATFLLTMVSSVVQMSVSRKAMKLESKENGMTFAMISGIQKIKNAGAEKRAFARWAELYAQQAEVNYRPPLFLRLSSVIALAITLTGTLVIYCIAIREGVSASQYIAFSSAYAFVSAAFTSLAGVAATIASIRPMKEMIKPFLDTPCETSEERKLVEHVSGNIDIDNVSFRYTEDGPMVLENLSLKIRKGDYVAVVGETGCGKSTLVKLLLGFITPEAGAIYYDSHDLKSLDPVSLRRNIGSVLQDGRLMVGDVYQNITLSAPWLTMKDAWEAAEIAGISEDIHEFPMGMFTMISEQGGVSGGQRQRILIARAIAPRPKILIFDEATSALDNITQKKISDALDHLSCTRIVIAHRLSTIRNCSRILVMRDGRIEEEGTYEELIARKGYFAALVDRQRLDGKENG